MKRVIWLTTVCLILLLATTGCSGHTVKVDESMNGQTLNVKAGDVIAVKLAGNPTTGYNWIAADLDKAILSQSGEAEFKAGSNLIGAGGMITLKFKAEGPGTTTLTLNYMRAWESVQPLQVFTVTIIVE
jgi:inhibitor of cysteine peptidase